MTAPDPLRRRLVLGLGAAGALAAAGGAWWLTGRSEGPGTAAATTTAAETTITGRRTTTAATSPPTSSTEATTTQPTTIQPTRPAPEIIEVIGRAAWGAAAATAAYTGHVVDRLTVHHTGRRLEHNRLAPQRLRGHQRFHQRDRGWVDLAYHYMIDAAGNVYESRPATAVGDTATDYDPAGHLLVCCEGNFDEQDLPAAQRAALVAVLAAAAAAHRVGADTISGHRDHAATSCPGAGLAALLDDGRLVALVEEQITEGAPVLEISAGPDAAARVRTIEQS